MKSKKWVMYILGTLLTLIALTAVGLAGFRIGMTQSAAFARMDRVEKPAFNQNLDNNDAETQYANPAPNGGDPRGNHFNAGGFDRGHRGMPTFGRLFGLIHIAILAVLLWFGYKFVQKSGWRLVRVQNETSTASEPVRAEVEEKKESE